MAFRLFAPPATALAGLGYYHANRTKPLFAPHRCEGGAFGFGFGGFQRQRPMAPKPRSGYDPVLYRQISTGSFVGLAVGLCVARFGRMLCLVVGALFLVVEALARQGIDVIPAGRIKRWVEELDLRGLVLKNTAFKVSFGTAFILASMYG